MSFISSYPLLNSRSPFRFHVSHMEAVGPAIHWLPYSQIWVGDWGCSDPVVHNACSCFAAAPPRSLIPCGTADALHLAEQLVVRFGLSIIFLESILFDTNNTSHAEARFCFQQFCQRTCSGKVGLMDHFLQMLMMVLAGEETKPSDRQRR